MSILCLPRCKGSFFQPTPAILLAAKRFIAGYMGEHFAAIHLRRNDFIDHLTLDTAMDCQYGDPGCFTLSIPQLAKCLDRALEAKGLSLLFVASDATAEEIELLKELLRSGGKTIIRIPRLENLAGHRWYQGLPKDDEMIYSVVEKTICAMSTVYISSFYSTFSQDIQRIRYDWNKNTCHDHLICRLE
jgi:peptide-O-fucosyltransferase